MITDRNDGFQIVFNLGCDENNHNKQTKRNTVDITTLEILSYLDKDCWK